MSGDGVFEGYRFGANGKIEFAIRRPDGQRMAIGLNPDDTYLLAMRALTAYNEAKPSTAPPLPAERLQDVQFGFFDNQRVMRLTRTDGAFLDILTTEQDEKLLRPVYAKVAAGKPRQH